jgi:hypothetical protein
LSAVRVSEVTVIGPFTFGLSASEYEQTGAKSMINKLIIKSCLDIL